MPTDAHTPRQILQWWGSEYRRAQNPQYWLERMLDTITRYRQSVAYPEQKPQLFVVPDTRFENEVALVHDKRWDGNVWHIRRSAVQSTDTHQSAIPLPVLEGERELYNNSTVDKLHQGIDLLLSTGAKFVRCEPMASNVEPYAGPWCCELGQATGVPVCDACAEASAGYSAAMGPDTSDLAKAQTEDERTIAVEYAKGH